MGLPAAIGLISLVIGFLVGKIFSSRFKFHKPNELSQEQLVSLNQRYAAEKKVLEAALQDIQEGVIVTNVEGFIIWTNRKALEILKTSEVAVGKNHISKILPVQKITEGQQDTPLRLTSLEGTAIFVGVKTYPLKDEAQQIIGNVYVVKDVTEELSLEEMKLDFVAIAAHQLRTPLTSIRGYLYLLAESIIPKINEEEKKFLQRSMISSDRLSSLIENLMNISRIEKGALKVVFKPIQLEEVVKQTVSNLMENAREKEVQLSMGNLVPPYPAILGDSSLLSEALTNIISNGIQYNHPGGQVTVSLQSEASGLTIHVSDNGKGIPIMAQNHLFQRFYQATGSLAELSNGLGLGLYISKSIVDAHKGKIWVNSIEGRGTTVSIFLPISSGSTA